MSTDAIYTPSVVTRFRGNPLIEALPPIHSQQEVLELLAMLPDVPDEKMRSLPPEIRLHELLTMQSLVVPMPAYAELGHLVSMMIRQGYVARNPSAPETLKRLQILNTTGQGSIPFPPFIETLSSAMVVSGVSGIGKSTFFRRLLSLYPQVIRHKVLLEQPCEWPQVVHIHVSCAPDGSITGFCRAFAGEVDRLLGTKYSRSFGTRTSRDEFLEIIKRIASNHFIGLIVVDELQNLREMSKDTPALLNFFADLAESSRIPVIMIGTHAVGKILKSDFKTASKLTSGGSYTFPQPESAEDETWNLLLRTLWIYQYVRNPVELNDTLRNAFFHQSVGNTRVTTMLFRLVQVRAINTGVETITQKLIDEVGKSALGPLQPALNEIRRRYLDKSLQARDDRFGDLSVDKEWRDIEQHLAAFNPSLHMGGLGQGKIAPEPPKASPAPVRKGKKADQHGPTDTNTSKGNQATTDAKDVRLHEQSKSVHATLKAEGLVIREPFDVE